MSEQPIDGNAAADEADKAGATSEGFGNLSFKDDAKALPTPAELADTDPRPTSEQPRYGPAAASRQPAGARQEQA
jgi:hypothetical protein